MMSGHKNPKTVTRYDHHRESLELNAVNFLDYTEQPATSRAGKQATVRRRI